MDPESYLGSKLSTADQDPGTSQVQECNRRFYNDTFQPREEMGRSHLPAHTVYRYQSFPST